jgi:hypothetical protein
MTVAVMCTASPDDASFAPSQAGDSVTVGMGQSSPTNSTRVRDRNRAAMSRSPHNTSRGLSEPHPCARSPAGQAADPDTSHSPHRTRSGRHNAQVHPHLTRSAYAPAQADRSREPAPDAAPTGSACPATSEAYSPEARPSTYFAAARSQGRWKPREPPASRP